MVAVALVVVDPVPLVSVVLLVAAVVEAEYPQSTPGVNWAASLDSSQSK